MKISTHPVLDNRPITQWKVTELKDELRRRKMPTKGLKEDLVRRLDEAICSETEGAEQEVNNGVTDSPHMVANEVDEKIPMVDETTTMESESKVIVSKTANDPVYQGEIRSPKMDNDLGQVAVYDGVAPWAEDNDQGEKIADTFPEGDEIPLTNAPAEFGNSVCVNLSSERELSGQGPQNTEMEKEDRNSGPLQDSDVFIWPSHEDVKMNLSDPNNQVSEDKPILGFPVKSDSITSDSLSNNETNILKVNLITDNVKLELNVKQEMVPPSSIDVVPGAGNSNATGVEEPYENKFFLKETHNTVTNAEMSRIICSADLGSSKKLNLDRSSGDESMEDDVLESKQIDSTYHSDELKERSEKSEMPMVKVEYPVVVHERLFEDRTDVNAENKKGVAENAKKRSLTDPEAGPNSEPSKRQCRWKPNNLMEPTRLTLAPSTTPIDILQPTPLKCCFSVPDANAGNSGPKECTVPPSTCGPTNSLRIDHFLRPFTLKAVHELLGKTGTVTSFWMDNIKTHCYVTYSSVEAAIKTRNAVYNLQWPPNGGRLLVAEFVDPEDVKLHAGAPFQPLATPISADLAAPVPSASPPQPSPHQANIRQQPLPAQPALPPPVIPNPPPAREWILAPPPALPLPLPLAVKLDPPTVTLDDLFRKTKAAPRIYYLPLAEEQVSAKQEARRRNTKQ